MYTSMTAALLVIQNAHRSKASMRKGDIHAAHLQELRGLALLLRCFLVGRDGGAVLHSLGGRSDEREELREGLFEPGDIAANLEDDILLDPLRQADAVKIIDDELDIEKKRVYAYRMSP